MAFVPESESIGSGTIRFLATFANRPMRNHFLLGPTVLRAKSEKYQSCESLEDEYENFYSKRLGI